MIHAGITISVLPRARAGADAAAEIARDPLEFVFIKSRVLQITRPVPAITRDFAAARNETSKRASRAAPSRAEDVRRDIG